MLRAAPDGDAAVAVARPCGAAAGVAAAAASRLLLLLLPEDSLTNPSSCFTFAQPLGGKFVIVCAYVIPATTAAVAAP